MADVAIYHLDRGTSWWCWLCPKHLTSRKKAGFDVKERKPAPRGVSLTCDDCLRLPPESEEVGV